MSQNHNHHVVIVGGGFGGLNVAKGLNNAPITVTLIDKRNFHLFQPLLYQVAMGGLSPGDIAHAFRPIFKNSKNVTVLKAEVTDILPDQRKVILVDGELSYETLIVATGSSHHYFGNDAWQDRAPGLKTIEDALTIRRRVLLAFEAAEREPDPEKRRAWLTFVVVGGGPTGVELAGSLAEMAHNSIKGDFRNFEPTEAKITLLEAVDRVLPVFPPDLSAKAAQALSDLGVNVQTKTMVTEIEEDYITVSRVDTKEQERIPARTVLWGAGMKASPMGKVLADRTGAELDRAGRIVVEPDLSVPGHPEIFVLGDLSNYAHQGGEPLPGLGSVALQQGKYVADLLKKRQQGKSIGPFRYVDKGTMAIVGRNEAVAQIGSMKLSGFVAWFVWVFVHIYFIIGFANKLLVLFQWTLSYLTYKRHARLITNEESFVLLEPNPKEQTTEEKTSSSGVLQTS